MKTLLLDEKWTFRRGYLDSISMAQSDPGTEVDLPHDGTISLDTDAKAPGGGDLAFYPGTLSSYTKNVFFPKEWEEECVGLQFDGAMMNASLDINGCRVALWHNGYMPFYADLTPYITFGGENRITINVNTATGSNSRWYTGSGLYRSVKLVHGPKVRIPVDGIFVYTKEVSEGLAYLEALIDVENAFSVSHMAEIELILENEKTGDVAAQTKRVIRIPAGGSQTARMAFRVEAPLLWSAEEPNLYRAVARVRDLGEYRTHPVQEKGDVDEASALFGIRTVAADVVRGLRINGKSVKLKGGCLHHDNGLLGAVSLYETEARKVKKLKELGFNAIRTAHNPPSAALIEACDRLGMYVFDEAFDAWSVGKRSSDYNLFFEADWERDLTAFIRRDRIHPSVILWSTGNEIPERGGLSGGYEKATALAEKIRSLDGTRPVSNGICSLWSGLDDALAVGQNQAQNAGDGFGTLLWEKMTEPFTNGLDVVGYNYMEDIYERDHELFPERVILGSENFPKQIGFRWPMVERLPYVIGDFTWTAWDYIGEVGLGLSVYVDPKDPDAPKNPWHLMAPQFKPYPWRLANDADFDLTGHRLPQGDYRSIVFGKDETHLYSMHPDTFDRKEIVSMWGFPYVRSCWNYAGFEGKPVEVVVFSRGEEVELIQNGKSLGRKSVVMEPPVSLRELATTGESVIMREFLPYSVRFETAYEPGSLEAISYRGGKEISRDRLESTGEATLIRLKPEKTVLVADGHDALYVEVLITDAEGRTVPDAEVSLTASVKGEGTLAGFGSADPVTKDNYTSPETVTYRGRAMAILRSGYQSGRVILSVKGEGLKEAELEVPLEPLK